MFKLIYPKFWHKPNIISYLLWPISIIYLLLGYLRNINASPVRFPSKVICVGNVSVGGTGKTQIVLHIAKLLKKRNINFVIITKAYGSHLTKAAIVENHHTALEVGDESLILREHGTVLATKKIHYALEYIEQIKPAVMIVDDFLQSPSFHKDITILSVDTHRFFGNGFLIPAGPLRCYPCNTLAKSDLIICVGATFNTLPSILLPYDNKIIYARISPIQQMDNTKNYFAFCGIGNPERFFSTMQTNTLKLSGYKIFPDHHYYSDDDVQYLQMQAQKYNALLITTKKDYIKLQNRNLNIICYDVELSINDQQKLLDLLDEKFS